MPDAPWVATITLGLATPVPDAAEPLLHAAAEHGGEADGLPSVTFDPDGTYAEVAIPVQGGDHLGAVEAATRVARALVTDLGLDLDLLGVVAGEGEEDDDHEHHGHDHGDGEAHEPAALAPDPAYGRGAGVTDPLVGGALRLGVLEALDVVDESIHAALHGVPAEQTPVAELLAPGHAEALAPEDLDKLATAIQVVGHELGQDAPRPAAVPAEALALALVERLATARLELEGHATDGVPELGEVPRVPPAQWFAPTGDAPAHPRYTA